MSFVLWVDRSSIGIGIAISHTVGERFADRLTCVPEYIIGTIALLDEELVGAGEVDDGDALGREGLGKLRHGCCFGVVLKRRSGKRFESLKKQNGGEFRIVVCGVCCVVVKVEIRHCSLSPSNAIAYRSSPMLAMDLA